jgi:hypothetical protein
MNTFLSLDNFQYLEGIFTRFLTDKGMSKLDFKKQLYSTMKTIQSERAASTPIKELNQMALIGLKQTIGIGTNTNINTNTISASTSPANGFRSSGPTTGPNNNSDFGGSLSLSLTRDSALYGSRPMNTTHLLPEIGSGKKDDVLEHFESARSMRSDVRPGVPPIMDIKPIDDKPLSGDTFNRQLEEMAAARKTIPDPSIAITETQKQIENSLTNNIMQDMSMSSQPHQRQMILSEIRAQNSDVQPKDAYSLPEVPATSVSVAHVSRTDFANHSRMSSLLEGPDPSTKLQDKFLLIHSLDRDWTLQKQRYRYKVKFAHSTQEIKRVPYYTNNKTVPHTATMTMEGIPNTSGWFDGDNNSYPPYDSSTADGDIIGYEELVFAVDNNANIQARFKNITAVQVTCVVVPMDIGSTTSSMSSVTTGPPTAGNPFFNHSFSFNYPYVLLQIDELTDVYEGTDDSIRRAFCQLVVDRYYQSSNGRGYIVLRPSQSEKKTFYPTTLASLPTLSISLLKPNGDVINKSQDGYTILKLEHEGYNRFYLKIVTNTYFDQNEFYKGDTVQIRHFTLFKLSNNQNSAHIARFNQFINQPTGHEILEIGDANDNGYFRTFYIRAPGVFDPLVGEYVLDDQLLEQLQIFNTSFDVTNNPANGYILNMSLQHSITMKIEQKVYDSLPVGSKNV